MPKVELSGGLQAIHILRATGDGMEKKRERCFMEVMQVGDETCTRPCKVCLHMLYQFKPGRCPLRGRYTVLGGILYCLNMSQSCELDCVDVRDNKLYISISIGV